MAPVIPNPDAILGFENEAAFEAWLQANHDKASELYLRIYKKGADVPTVTYAQAVEVALCWGWIDGLKKAYDESSFLQRFSPRKPKSIWSQINCQHVDRLTAAGRMTAHGQKHIDAAKADGRWDAAYAGASEMTVPDDLLAAIEAEPKALEMFQTLNKQNLYSLAFRTHNIKTPAGRAKKIAGFVEMLARGETLYPNGKKAEKP
jgi:uncharacterized protein YdeI (YjbR/CyaY-like superfamily)